MPRRINVNLAKIHRAYTVGEIALLYGVHKNTVRVWLKESLPIIDSGRPVMVLGRDLRVFLQNRKQKNKCKCELNEMYCLKCRESRTPYGGMADYLPMTKQKGRLAGICPVCDCTMNRYTDLTKLEQIRLNLDVTTRGSENT
jgi:hypothetical protein